MGLSKKLYPSEINEERRPVMDKEVPVASESMRRQWLREHMESLAHRGPNGTTTVRVAMRASKGYDATAKIVRGAYDRAEQTAKRGKRKGRKESK